MMKGVFIGFDGPNGVGKSTIIYEVSKKLIESGYDVISTKEPTESELGKFIRRSEEKYTSYTLACLVAADRYNHVETYINPNLNAGKIILCDRFICSSLVLQRMDGVDIDFIWDLNSKVIIPDIYFILTASSSTLHDRLAQRTHLTRFERDNKSEVELDYYNQAFDFLIKNNFHVERVNTENDMNVSVNRIISKIIDSISKR